MTRPHETLSFRVLIERMDCTGRKQYIDYESYGLLRELLDDVEEQAERRGWFKDDANAPA